MFLMELPFSLDHLFMIPKKPHQYNYLKERELACCPYDRIKVGPLTFHFLFNCMFRQTSRVYASGLASCEKGPFL